MTTGRFEKTWQYQILSVNINLGIGSGGNNYFESITKFQNKYLKSA